MLDSGSSVSLLKQEIAANTLGIVAGQREPGLRLISAAGARWGHTYPGPCESSSDSG